ncbi:hypothetical protein RFI_35725, partial [Reticulomyxa filosa]
MLSIIQQEKKKNDYGVRPPVSARSTKAATLVKKKICVHPHPQHKQRKIRSSHSALKKKQKSLHFFYCYLFFFFVDMICILNIWGEKKKSIEKFIEKKVFEKKINGKNIGNKWEKRGDTMENKWGKCRNESGKRDFEKFLLRKMKKERKKN